MNATIPRIRKKAANTLMEIVNLLTVVWLSPMKLNYSRNGESAAYRVSVRSYHGTIIPL